MDELAFGRYRLLSVLGEGGMGTVYKAHDTMMQRDVAVKVLSSRLADEPGYQERFRREAYAAASLTEPHIIPVHEAGEIDGQLYLVMPIIDGIDAGALLRRDGPMNPERAVHIIEQLAAALDAAHAVGLVHRDVKPSNALVTVRDFAYLIDFGVAHDAAATKLTNTGMIVGTMAYLAPERFTTGVADARSDVYALACVLHECLTGQQPYPGTSMEQQVAGHLSLEPPRPSVQRIDVPITFDDVIARGMAKDPWQRFQSAHELAAAARAALLSTDMVPTVFGGPVLQPIPWPAPVWQQPPSPPKHRVARVLVPAILAVLLFGASVFAITQVMRPRPSASPEWQAYVDGAKQCVITLTTLDYQKAAEGVQRIADCSTGSFRDDFLKRSADFTKVVTESKVVEQGTVESAGLVDISGTTAHVVIASTSKVTNAAGAAQDPRHFRLIVQVEKLGDSYKLSKVEFVP